MKQFTHTLRRTAALLLAAAAALPALRAEESPKNGIDNLLKAALRGWHVKLSAGFNLGGTSPLPLPREIRGIDSYNPTMCVSIEGAVQKRFEDSPWGMLIGVRLETKGMKTDATVKNYHMEMTERDGGYMEGAFTGHVKTKVRNTYLTFPVLATYAVGDRWTVSAGPYVAWMYDGDFSGAAYDGYLRHGDPTGPRADVSEATYDFSDDLRKFQWGVQAGAEWKAYKHLSVYANLEWGVNSIFPADFGGVTFDMYPIYANVGFSYLF